MAKGQVRQPTMGHDRMASKQSESSEKIKDKLPAIYCSHMKMVDITDLQPHPRNPNRHPDTQIALLAKIIRHQGWRAPITVSKRSGFIIKGHGRLQAAQLLGIEKVPVDIQPYENEAQEWADMIADNRIAELAEMDLVNLKDLLQEMDTGDLDMDLTGYDKMELERLMTQLHIPENNKEIDEEKLSETNCTCPKCGFSWMKT